VLLLVWVVFILAAPNMAPYVTSQLLPVPSRESVDREKMALQRERQREFEQLVEEWKDEKGLADDVQWWSDDDLQARAREHWEGIQEEMQKVEDSYLARIQAQTRWSGIIARVSPLTSFNLAAFDLAAAGMEQETSLVEALKTYSQSWEEYSNEKQKAWREFMEEQRRSGGGFSFSSEDMARFRLVDLSDYPRFDFEYMPFSQRLGLVYGDLGLLAVWNVLFFMGAYLSFLRYDVQ
jgi:hypothetical protein